MPVRVRARRSETLLYQQRAVVRSRGLMPGFSGRGRRRTYFPNVPAREARQTTVRLHSASPTARSGQES